MQNNALLAEGKGLDFLRKLEFYDSITVNDQLIKNNDSIDIHITKENGQLKTWTISEKLTQLSSKKKKEGSSLKALYDVFSGKEIRYDSSIAVLALKQTSYQKRSDKKIESTWFMVDIDCPYEETKEGRAYLQTINLVLNKEEYRLMMETRLAIYDMNKGIVYPFLAVSASSIGKSLDAATLFKKCDTGTAGAIGAAMFLADRISRRSINLIIRDQSDIFKPILSVAGKSFTPPYPVEFYKAVYESLSQKGLFCLHHWTCNSDRVVAEFMQPGTQSLIEVTLGLIPGVVTMTKFYKVIEKAKILLKTNKLTRMTNNSVNLCSKDAMSKLFKGIEKVFTDFDICWNSSALDILCDTDKWLSTFPALLGKKNLNKVKKEISGEMKKRDFYEKLLVETKDLPLSAYYKNIKETYYWELLTQLSKEEK